jgi:hypothetical protein
LCSLLDCRFLLASICKDVEIQRCVFSFFFLFLFLFVPSRLTEFSCTHSSSRSLSRPLCRTPIRLIPFRLSIVPSFLFLLPFAPLPCNCFKMPPSFDPDSLTDPFKLLTVRDYPDRLIKAVEEEALEQVVFWIGQLETHEQRELINQERAFNIVSFFPKLSSGGFHEGKKSTSKKQRESPYTDSVDGTDATCCLYRFLKLYHRPHRCLLEERNENSPAHSSDSSSFRRNSSSCGGGQGAGMVGAHQVMGEGAGSGERGGVRRRYVFPNFPPTFFPLPLFTSTRPSSSSSQ